MMTTVPGQLPSRHHQRGRHATGRGLAPYGALILAVRRGRANELSALVDATLAVMEPRGQGIGVSTCQWVTALLRTGLGHYEEANGRGPAGDRTPRKPEWTLNVSPGVVHAAVRSGHPQQAREALEQLIEITRPSGAVGVWESRRAGEPRWVSHPRRNCSTGRRLDRLGRTRVRGEHAFAHLLDGDWLRRRACGWTPRRTALRPRPGLAPGIGPSGPRRLNRPRGRFGRCEFTLCGSSRNAHGPGRSMSWPVDAVVRPQKATDVDQPVVRVQVLINGEPGTTGDWGRVR